MGYEKAVQELCPAGKPAYMRGLGGKRQAAFFRFGEFARKYPRLPL
jgi:hypothetical protein